MSNLEAQFHQAMFDLYRVAKRACNYRATIFLDMVTEQGGLAAAKRLLATDKPSDGFNTLYLCGCLDLSVEAQVSKPEFQPLFTPGELATAKQRLEDVNYRFEHDR